MFGDESYIDKPKTFAMMKERGIARAVVDFSGGNDEGGADGIAFYTADGTELKISLSSPAHPEQEFDNLNRRWVSIGWTVNYNDGTAWKKRPATPDEIALAELSQLLEAPVYDAYGSFAGEFYVNGTVTWDAVAGTCVMSKDESVEQYEHSEQSF